MNVMVMVTAGMGLAGLMGCKTLPPPTPLAELNGQQAQGHAVYQAHCAVCHSDRTNAILHGPALRGIFKKDYLPSGAPANDERVTATILHGRNTMPALKWSKLDDPGWIGAAVTAAVLTVLSEEYPTSMARRSTYLPSW